jgi:hypothetical protein
MSTVKVTNDGCGKATDWCGFGGCGKATGDTIVFGTALVSLHSRVGPGCGVGFEVPENTRTWGAEPLPDIAQPKIKAKNNTQNTIGFFM